MTILTLALLVHHADEVAKPVYLLVLLFRSEIETLDIILLDNRQRAAVSTDDILNLPHI